MRAEFNKKREKFLENENCIKKSKRRKLKVKEAMKILRMEEAEKLIDDEKVTKNAVKRTEQSTALSVVQSGTMDIPGDHEESCYGVLTVPMS